MLKLDTFSACNFVDIGLQSPSGDYPTFSFDKDPDWATSNDALVKDDFLAATLCQPSPIPASPATLIENIEHDHHKEDRYDTCPENKFTFNVKATDDGQHEFNDYLDISLAMDENEHGELIFPFLPPLHQGHMDTHLRRGIMDASRFAAAGEPDAEKAFFVADLGQVYSQHCRWMEYLPEIQPFYAIKCNPDPYVLRLLAALGTGFDCASNNEIAQVLDLGGIDTSRIIYANPCKATSFVRNAARMGVDLMTFDNVDELHKVARAHPRARLVLRILTDDSKSLCAFGIKFGAPLDTVRGLLKKAKELNLDVVGVSFHVGSGCYDPTVYRDAIHRARRVFEMGEEVGYRFTLLDVGGGFEDALFEQAAQVLKSAIDEFFPDRKERGIKSIAEPGRFYVSKAFKLATNIIARRAPVQDGHGIGSGQEVIVGEVEQPKVMYYINDGVYGAFNCILFDHQNPKPYVLYMNGVFYTPGSRDQDRHQHNLASVWGPTCDSIDCVSKGTMLPTDLQVGDWLGFDNMGAYTMCAASQFNGFEVSKVVYTVHRHAEEIKKLLVGFWDGRGYRG